MPAFGATAATETPRVGTSCYVSYGVPGEGWLGLVHTYTYLYAYLCLPALTYTYLHLPMLICTYLCLAILTYTYLYYTTVT